jgi:DNA-binding transcriptional LysR family regulator
MDAFRRNGLTPPSAVLSTYSVELRTKLIATGHYVGAFARSVITPDAERSLKILPIELPLPPWPVVLITVKHRALNPVARRFIEYLREARSLCAKPQVAEVQQATSPKAAP